MLTVIALIAPLFSLIAIGFLVGRFGYLSAGADRLLAEFGFKVAMPALLFRATSTFDPLPSSPLQLIAVYFSATFLIWFIASLATRYGLGRPAPDAPVVAMAACFGNTVMLGIPLSLIVLGEAAAAPAAILIAIETPLLWIMATLHGEWADRGGRGVSPVVLWKVVVAMARNPIVLSIVLGVSWRATGIATPEALDDILSLLGQAAIPTALVALGLTLANFSLGGEAGTLSLIGALKLALFPGLVFGFGLFADIPATWLAVAILFAAMPTGANAYLNAARSGRMLSTISASLVLTTVLAAATLSILIYVSGWSA